MEVPEEIWWKISTVLSKEVLEWVRVEIGENEFELVY